MLRLRCVKLGVGAATTAIDRADDERVENRWTIRKARRSIIQSVNKLARVGEAGRRRKRRGEKWTRARTLVDRVRVQRGMMDDGCFSSEGTIAETADDDGKGQERGGVD